MNQQSYPLVSVIIPVYNREDYIIQALNSVLLEDYPNKEIVIIDDGSSDKTRLLIEDWLQEHKARVPILFKSRPNRGFVKTLNELIQLSRGAYIVFFGSDDYLQNNGIIKRYKYLQSHPDKLMVLGDAIQVDEHGIQVHDSAYVGIGQADKNELMTDHGLKKYMILNGYVPGATLMADKRIYQQLGLYDETLFTEDWVYYIRVVAIDKLGFLDENVAAYRRHSGNACFSKKMVTTAKQQFRLSLSLFNEFKGIYRFYMIKRLLFSCLYIPYLSIKFDLLNAEEQLGAQNKKTGYQFIRFLRHMLGTLKEIFIKYFGLYFARSL